MEFGFRVWVYPDDGDPADVEVWYQGLESIAPDTCFESDWARECFYNEDFYDIFDLDKTKNWQVVGKFILRGSRDYFGEYEEELEVIEFEKVEVPESFYY